MSLRGMGPSPTSPDNSRAEALGLGRVRVRFPISSLSGDENTTVISRITVKENILPKVCQNASRQKTRRPAHPSFRGAHTDGHGVLQIRRGAEPNWLPATKTRWVSQGKSQKANTLPPPRPLTD